MKVILHVLLLLSLGCQPFVPALESGLVVMQLAVVVLARFRVLPVTSSL